jgi:hypothetical protein
MTYFAFDMFRHGASRFFFASIVFALCDLNSVSSCFGDATKQRHVSAVLVLGGGVY